MGRPGFDPWVGKIPWRRERLPTPVFWPGEFHGLYIVYGVAKSLTQQRDFHFTFFHWAGPIGYYAISVHCLSSRGKLTESFTTTGSPYKVSELFPNCVILVTCFGTEVYLWGFPLKCGIPKETSRPQICLPGSQTILSYKLAIIFTPTVIWDCNKLFPNKACNTFGQQTFQIFFRQFVAKYGFPPWVFKCL